MRWSNISRKQSQLFAKGTLPVSIQAPEQATYPLCGKKNVHKTEICIHEKPDGPQTTCWDILSAAKACAKLAKEKSLKWECLDNGRKVHQRAQKAGFVSHPYVVSTLIEMYARCGSMCDAQGVFDTLDPRLRDVVIWTALISGYVDNSDPYSALHLFDRMPGEGCEPNERTIVVALKACSGGVDMLERGMQIHLQAARAGLVNRDVFIGATLINMYATCGSLVDARAIFDRIPLHDVVCWNTLILAYAENGEPHIAFNLFSYIVSTFLPTHTHTHVVLQLQGHCIQANFQTFMGALAACTCLVAREETGALEKVMEIHSQALSRGYVTDIYISSTLVALYTNCGSLYDARSVFDKMEAYSLVTWNALLVGYVECEGHVTLELLEVMEISPDSRTYSAAVKACGTLVDLSRVRAIHAEVCRWGFERDLVLNTDLVDVYGKCGGLVEAQCVFDALLAKDTVVWCSLMNGYSRQGDSRRVLELFKDMKDEGIEMNAVVFVCFLTACSHSGLVKVAKQCFDSMEREFKVAPGVEHYVCMVDVFGRANRMYDAVEIVERLCLSEGDGVVVRSVLAACMKWENVEGAKAVLELVNRVKHLDEATSALKQSVERLISSRPG